jgi:Na+-driven multidrug efflux pump
MDAPPPQRTPSVYVEDPGRAGFIEPTLLRRIVTLGLPVIIGMMTQTLINQVDGMFIGRLPEEQAVPGHAAMGPSLILLWAFGGFLSAISGGDDLGARHHRRHRPRSRAFPAHAQ